jgi:hypothetical protein
MKKTYLYVCFVFCLLVCACQEDIQKITKNNNNVNMVVAADTVLGIMYKEIELPAFFIKYDSLNIYKIAEKIEPQEAMFLSKYQRKFSKIFKERLTLNYQQDSLKTARAINLIMLKAYYYQPIRLATYDMRGFFREQLKGRTKADFDTFLVEQCPLAYYLARYAKFKDDSYEIWRVDAIPLGESSSWAAKIKSFKNYKPFKVLLKKLKSKKYDSD